jgi:hypothetical protein
VTQQLITPDASDVSAVYEAELARIVELVGTAESLTIASDEQYVNADKLLGELKASYKAADTARARAKEPYLRAGQALDAGFKPVKEAFDRGEQAVKRGMATFKRERELAAAAEQARLREVQDKERAKLAERAEKAEARNRPTQAAQLREQAESMPVATVSPEIPKTGTSYRKVWRWEVIDKAGIKGDYMVPDEKAIQAVVEAMGARAEQTVGGINVWQEEIAIAPRGRS